MRKRIKVSVIIVHYGARKEVLKCLDGLKEIYKKDGSVEFIFVDNEGNTGIGTKVRNGYPWINYIKSPSNLGFGGGRNFGRKYAKGEYLFCLDSDVVIDYKSFERVYKFIKKNKRAGLVAPSMVNISGKFTPQATKELTPLRGIFYLSFLQKFFPNNPISKKYLISGWDRSNTREVEVTQLGGFMIRTKAFDDVGGFDEKMFLYFEENDLAMNLKKKGWRIYFYPEATITHLESKGTPKDTIRIKKVFAESRFHYFKKHYGLISASIVELFSRISKYSLVLFGILVLATFLRFYRIQENLVFHGEIGTDYVNVLDMISGKRTFLLGPRTSHEWFSIPPLAYWIYAVILILGNYNPLAVTIFWGIVGVASILVCYFCIKEFFDRKVALVSAFLLAISPNWISLTRDSRYNALAAVLFFPYLLLLKKSLEDKGKSLFSLGFVLGLMMSFFPSPILLVPAVIATFVIFRVKPLAKNVFESIFGFLIPNLPFIIYEFGHKFEITTKLLEWIPYRIFGFLGIYDKNTFDFNILKLNLWGLGNFFSEVLLVLIISFLVIKLDDIKKIAKSKSLIILMIVFMVGYLGLFVHGDAPKHYYLTILPIPIIFASVFISKINNKHLLLSILGGLFLFNLWNMQRTNWFYSDLNRDYTNSPVPYGLQLRIVDKIISDSKGQPISLGRVGVYDEFENNFANGYIYLMRIRGEQINPDAKLKYTIYERTSDLPEKGTTFWIENIAVSKNE